MTMNAIIKGMPASKGVATGVVRVVEATKNISQFNSGDILVTEMTEPSMVVMMNKAGAVVTNVGGLTCHAAIVCREIGIPCVVATQNATTQLKNGMKVKVNGNNGEVVLLKGDL